MGWGFSGLTRDNRYAPGYSSVRQRWFDQRVGLQGALGKTSRDAVRNLFSRERLTGRRWIDLLGYRVLLAHESRVPAIMDRARGRWVPVQRSQDFVKLAPAPGGVSPSATGRVTAVLGEAEVTPEEVSGERQTYAVQAPAGARLVFRDLFWPGYVATLDGSPLPVVPFRRTLVSVELPPGSEGTLDLRFRPHTARSLSATLGTGAVLLVGAILLQRGGRARHRPAQAR